MYNPNIITEVCTASSIRRRFEELSHSNDSPSKVARRNFTITKKSGISEDVSNRKSNEGIIRPAANTENKTDGENEATAMNLEEIENHELQPSHNENLMVEGQREEYDCIGKDVTIQPLKHRFTMMPSLSDSEGWYRLKEYKRNKTVTSNNNSNISEDSCRFETNWRTDGYYQQNATDEPCNFEIIERQIIMRSSKRGQITSMLPNEINIAYEQVGQAIRCSLNKIQEEKDTEHQNSDNLYEEIESIKNEKINYDQDQDTETLAELENFQSYKIPMTDISTTPTLKEISSSLKSLEPQNSEFSSPCDCKRSTDTNKSLSSCSHQIGKINPMHVADANRDENVIESRRSISISISVITSDKQSHGNKSRRKDVVSLEDKSHCNRPLALRLSEPLEYKRLENQFPVVEKSDQLNHKISGTLYSVIDDSFEFLNCYN